MSIALRDWTGSCPIRSASASVVLNPLSTSWSILLCLYTGSQSNQHKSCRVPMDSSYLETWRLSASIMQGLGEFIQSPTVPKVAGRIGSTYLPLDLAWAGDTIPGYPRKVGERSLPSAAPYEMGYFSSFPFCYICSIPVIFSISISICQRYPPYSIHPPYNWAALSYTVLHHS